MPTTGKYTPFENAVTAPLPPFTGGLEGSGEGKFSQCAESFSVRSSTLCGEESSPRYEYKQINSDK